MIEDSDFHRRAFEWKLAFPEIFPSGASGGFDIVIGNPPYVRMELLTPFKPYLEKRYEVVADRADLYAYFFELGVRLLKVGGRLGYISSSTFFRTGSGEALRRYLTDKARIEAVVDFGDLQIFGGVTTYPAIVTLRRINGHSDDDDLRFLKANILPDDLTKAFVTSAQRMPRARLGAGPWRFEGDRLDAIRTKMAAGRKTLAEVYGAPQRGIVTGLNDAFVLGRERRDALIARDARSADLLKPFLVGKNLKRWHVESDDLWLIYTPKNRINIETYPAIRDHLASFREALEMRATKQNWWELQQAQAAYENGFRATKVVYPEISQGPKFSVDRNPHYLSNKVFFVPRNNAALVALLGSKIMWLILFGLASPLRGGQWRLELREQYMSTLPVPAPSASFAALEPIAIGIQTNSEESRVRSMAFLARLNDVAPGAQSASFLQDWTDFTFDELRRNLKKRLKVEIPVGERDEWERYFNARKAEVEGLSARIADAEAEINDRVYRLFDLDRDEIALIEEEIAGQY